MIKIKRELNKVTKGIPAPEKREVPINYHMDNEYPGMLKILHFSTNLLVSPYLESTAVRVPESIYGGAPLSEVRLSSEEYLLNFKRSSIDFGPSIGIGQYSASYPPRAALAGIQGKERDLVSRVEGIKLPPHKKLKSSFDSVIAERRSRRSMSGESMSLQQLSTLLYYGDGVTGEYQSIDPSKESDWPKLSLGEPEKVKLRTAASAGSLYPVYLYLLIRNVDDIEDGLYKYLPNTHSLAHVRKLTADDWEQHDNMSKSWGANMNPKNVNVAVFYVYSLYENSRKYADQGLVFALIETGSITQNIHLAASGMNLVSSCVGGDHKAIREKFLGIDGLSKHSIHLTIIGNAE